MGAAFRVYLGSPGGFEPTTRTFTSLKSFFFFWPQLVACGIFTPQPEMELWPPAVEAWSLNHWTTWEVPKLFSNGTLSWDSFKANPMMKTWVQVVYLEDDPRNYGEGMGSKTRREGGKCIEGTSK